MKFNVPARPLLPRAQYHVSVAPSSTKLLAVELLPDQPKIPLDTSNQTSQSYESNG